MGKRSDIDKAVRNIMKWADRPEWAGARAAAFDAHIAPVCELLSISAEELNREVEGYNFGGMLFGMMFEDFLSWSSSPNNRNVIDDYLERRGWRESVSGRRYLQQLRDSIASIYEVVEVSPGQHCELADLVRGGKTIRVYEHMGTQNMVKWDRVAARVLTMDGKHVFSGGVMSYPHEASQYLLANLAKSRKQFDKKRSREANKKSKVDVSFSENQDDVFLKSVCPAITSIWLLHTLEKLEEPLPTVINRDGAALVFSETRFPILTENSIEAAERLDCAAEWVPDGHETDTWIWLAEPDAAGKKPKSGIAFDSLLEGQQPIIGTLELKPGVLTLYTNSQERAERGTEVLQELLHNLIGPALSLLQTPEQLMSDESHQKSERTSAIDPKIEAEIVHDMLDQHYRQCLDEPIPALNNRTPRQCARSKAGRKKVIEWLKLLENTEQRRATDQGQKPYDSAWMWDELKLVE